MRVVTVLIAMATSTASCDASDADDSSELVHRVEAAREHMHRSFAAAKTVQLAIAVGDLDRAHDEARQLAARDEPDFLPRWRPYLGDIGAAAADIAASADTIAAARSIARLGDACARCHEAAAAKVVFPREARPTSSGMASHQWAAARMWEGVIGPSNDRWLEGARALGSSTTLTAESGALGVADDAARVKLLADRAARLSDRSARATLFGDLLATCARCHAAIRDRAIGDRPRAWAGP